MVRKIESGNCIAHGDERELVERGVYESVSRGHGVSFHRCLYLEDARSGENVRACSVVLGDPYLRPILAPATALCCSAGNHDQRDACKLHECWCLGKHNETDQYTEGRFD